MDTGQRHNKQQALSKQHRFTSLSQLPGVQPSTLLCSGICPHTLGITFSLELHSPWDLKLGLSDKGRSRPPAPSPVGKPGCLFLGTASLGGNLESRAWLWLGNRTKPELDQTRAGLQWQRKQRCLSCSQQAAEEPTPFGNACTPTPLRVPIFFAALCPGLINYLLQLLPH